MTVEIHADYPGGNIIFKGITGNRIALEQDMRDTSEWWFYWNFCVQSKEDGEFVFEFTNGEVVGPWGPAVSLDRIHWSWLGSDSAADRTTFVARLSAGQTTYFSFCIPYLGQDFERFYRNYELHPLLSRQTLAFSEQKRPILLVKLGNARAERHIVVTCRHHACEAPSSYMLEGIIEYLLEHEQSPVTRDYLVHIIPFVDVDGVENGDQGKNRAPHDHNRDYLERPVYKSTLAINKYVSALGRIAIGLDLHAPYRWGSRHNYPHFVKGPSPHKEGIEALSSHLQAVTANDADPDKIPFLSAMDLDVGVDWNTGTEPSFSTFMRKKGASLALTVELPYFGIGNTVYTARNTKAFGRNFAISLERYVSELG